MNKQVFRSVMSSKGQVVLPKELRDQLGLETGMTVEFLKEGGKVTLEVAPSGKNARQTISSDEFLSGRLRIERPFPADDEFEAAILKEAARRYHAHRN